MSLCRVPFKFWYRPFWSFWLFSGSRSCLIAKKSCRKDSWTKITRYYLRRHFAHIISSRRHLCLKPPETFESKWYLFRWKNHISIYRCPSGFCDFTRKSPVFCSFDQTWKWSLAARLSGEIRSKHWEPTKCTRSLNWGKQSTSWLAGSHHRTYASPKLLNTVVWSFFL